MTFIEWQAKKYIAGEQCKAEPGTKCIVLRDDPICRQCYKDETKEEGA